MDLDKSEEIVESPIEKETEAHFKEIYEEAKENYSVAKGAWDEIHSESISDIEFALLGKQWDAQILSQRTRDKRTSKVFDNCAKFIRYVVNSSMKNSPAIRVNPKNKDKKKEADIIAGIVRQIENDSNAKNVYSCAFQDCVAGGIGVFEVVVDSDDAENPIKIKRIIDPTSVYFDPTSIEPDFSDATYVIRTKSISKNKFKKLYPKISTECSKSDTVDWFAGDNVKILEYWTKDSEGNIEWYILNGNQIIDSSINYGGYPGTKYFPFCVVLGEDVIVNGQRHIKSIIRDIKDRQIYSNFVQSETIDFISRSAQAGWIISDKTAEKSLELYQNRSKNNNVYVYPQGSEKPTRVDPAPAPMGFVEEISRLEQDMRSQVGIRDPFKEDMPTQSGKATQLQLSQQNLNTYVWTSHLECAIRYCGRVLVNLIPNFYNYPHTTQIIGIDGQQNSEDIMTPNENGEMLDLSSSEYSVSLSTGASYADQQEATFDKLLELYKANPQLFSIGSDLLIKNLDIIESEVLADRLYAMLPPQIQALNKTDNQDPKMMMMQMQKQMEEMGKILEQTTQALTQKTQEANELQNMVQNKSQMEMMKLDSQNQNKLQTEVMSNQSAEQQIAIKSESDYRIKEMELQYQLKMKELDVEMERIKSQNILINPIPQNF